MVITRVAFQASTLPEGTAGVLKGSAVQRSGGGTRRSFSQGRSRFERKAAVEAEQKHINYEAEDLPNGFTKIRKPCENYS